MRHLALVEGAGPYNGCRILDIKEPRRDPRRPRIQPWWTSRVTSPASRWSAEDSPGARGGPAWMCWSSASSQYGMRDIPVAEPLRASNRCRNSRSRCRRPSRAGRLTASAQLRGARLSPITITGPTWLDEPGPLPRRHPRRRRPASPNALTGSRGVLQAAIRDAPRRSLISAASARFRRLTTRVEGDLNQSEEEKGGEMGPIVVSRGSVGLRQSLVGPALALSNSCGFIPSHPFVGLPRS